MSENRYECKECHGYHLEGTKPCMEQESYDDSDINDKLDRIIELLEKLLGGK